MLRGDGWKGVLSDVEGGWVGVGCVMLHMLFGGLAAADRVRLLG